MEPNEIRSLLNEGIQAVRANDRPTARARLLRVLEADDHNEAAWLWLSAALDAPADQLLALEQVLAINPRHAQALAAAQSLRQGLNPPAAPPLPVDPSEAPALPSGMAAGDAKAATLEPAPQAATVTAAPAAVALSAEPAGANYDTLLAEDDPFQCAYCGRPTHPDDERCAHCGRGLLVPGPWRGGGYLYLSLLATGIQLQTAMVQALAAYLLSSYPQALSILPFASAWASPWQVPALLRTIAWAVVVLLLLGEYTDGYGIAALVATVDLAWAGVGYWLGMLPSAATQINAGAAVIILFVGILAVISRAQSRVRLRVVLDRHLEAASLLHERALAYARQGKWALAALHWRRAIGRAPAEGLYYKSLGRANVALGRYAEAVRAFKSGAEVAPEDRDFSRLIETVRAHTRSS